MIKKDELSKLTLILNKNEPTKQMYTTKYNAKSLNQTQLKTLIFKNLISDKKFDQIS